MVLDLADAMRVVLLGYQTWRHRVLEALLASRHDVVLVVTHPPSDDAYETTVEGR